MDRYEVRVGKFGCYFYDLVEKRDVTLPETAELLNSLAYLNSELITFQGAYEQYHRQFIVGYGYDGGKEWWQKIVNLGPPLTKGKG